MPYQSVGFFLDLVHSTTSPVVGRDAVKKVVKHSLFASKIHAFHLDRDYMSDEKIGISKPGSSAILAVICEHLEINEHNKDKSLRELAGFYKSEPFKGIMTKLGQSADTASVQSLGEQVFRLHHMAVASILDDFDKATRALNDLVKEILVNAQDERAD